jgi:hypothetical protein
LAKYLFNFAHIRISIPKSIEKCFECEKTECQRCLNHKKKIENFGRKLEMIEQALNRLRQWQSVVERIKERDEAYDVTKVRN